MAKKADSKNPSSWRKLKRAKMPAKTKRASISWRIRLRQFFRFMRWVFLALLIAALGYGGYYAWQNLCVEDIFAPKHIPLKSVEFKSDGAINAHWLAGILKIPKDSTIADINIFHLQRVLEDVSQIKSAKIERVYPDILRIDVKENKALAKILVRIDFKDVIFVISPEGTTFRPICYTPEMLDGLLFVEGAKFESGKKMACAKKLGEFLKAARERFPEEVSKWFSADVSQMDSITLPLITIRTKADTKIIFDMSDLKKQFDKFDYILRYSKQRSLNDFEKIDLSLKDRADAKLRTNSR